MNLSLAIFIPGILLVGLGAPLLFGNQRFSVLIKTFPRSSPAAFLFFGTGASWFLFKIWNLSVADFGDHRVLLMGFFAGVAVGSFKWVPDFLAVRGVCILILICSMPLLMAGFMDYDHPALYLQKGLLYIAIVFAIWLGAQPWRFRNFVEWLFIRPKRAIALGGFLALYGFSLCGVAMFIGA
jgi:hypothetical protein